MNSAQQETANGANDEIASDLAAYALGALEPEQRQKIDDLVVDDLALQAELEEMLDTVAQMTMRMGQETPPKRLRAKLLDGIADEAYEMSKAPVYSALINHIEQVVAPQSATQYAAPGFIDRIASTFTSGRIALATSVASFFIVAILALQLGADNASLNRKVDEMERSVASANSFTDKMMDEMAGTENMLVKAEQRITEQSNKIEELTMINDALRASVNDQISLTYATLRNEYQTPSWLPDASTDEGAYIHLLEHRSRPLAALLVGGMAQAPPGEEYRLYLIRDDGAEYAASFDLNEAGYCTVLFQISSPLSSYDGAHITREKVGEPPNPQLAEPANRYRLQ